MHKCMKIIENDMNYGELIQIMKSDTKHVKNDPIYSFSMGSISFYTITINNTQTENDSKILRFKVFSM